MSSPKVRLNRLRKLLGLSQRELASEFQVSSGAIASWELGDREIPGSVMKLLEIYESELTPSTQTSDEPSVAVTSELLHAFTSAVTIRDRELLPRIKTALAIYLRECAGATKLKQRIHALVLKELISSLGELRGLPMKIAQIVSFLDPSIPPELREVLASLQHCGRAMPFKTVSEIINAEFGRDPDELFAQFDRQPVAAASIGQVHRVQLDDGTWVAVKVQYPEIRAKLDEGFGDFEFVRQLSLFVGSDAPELQALIRELHATVIDECDYEKEAANQHRIGEIFTDDPEIIVPKVFFSRSSKRVLTSEWIDGKSWQEFKHSASQSERNRASQIIAKFNAKNLFVRGLFHADPHPGNFLFLDGQIAFIDYGRVKEVSTHVLKQIAQLHMLMLNRDREQTRTFLESSDLFRMHPAFDFELCWKTLLILGEHFQHSGELPISKELLVEQRAAIKALVQSRSMSITSDVFWTMLFAHPIMLAGREDLGAVAGWRHILSSYV